MEKQEEKQKRQTYAKIDKLYHKLIWGSFIAICLLILQAFISATPDVAIYISLSAVGIAIPPLAGCFLVSSCKEAGLLEDKDWNSIMHLLAVIGIFGTIVGVDAALWHVNWLIGVAFLISALVSYFVFLNYVDTYAIE